VHDNVHPLTGKVALVTGAAHRIGAAIAGLLHRSGMNLVLHCRTSRAAADRLAQTLNQARAQSCVVVQGDLLDDRDLARVPAEAIQAWGQLDVLVNNASTFYPTPVGTITSAQWDALLGPNLKAPFFLAQAVADELGRQAGCIVNIVDIHATHPMKGYPVYSIAKAGLAMLTKTLARELGPAIRVNGVAPGAILWPEHEMSDASRQQIIARTALKRQGEPDDIARAVLFLVRDADYITGEIITVDGGRSLGI
jgi:pteridine reductase